MFCAAFGTALVNRAVTRFAHSASIFAYISCNSPEALGQRAVLIALQRPITAHRPGAFLAGLATALAFGPRLSFLAAHAWPETDGAVPSCYRAARAAASMTTTFACGQNENDLRLNQHRHIIVPLVLTLGENMHFDDYRLWATVGVVFTLIFHFLNRRPRAEVDKALLPLKVPERRFCGYSASALAEFRAHASSAQTASGQNALVLYRQYVLIVDMGFAISLAVASYCIWKIVMPGMGPSAALNWVSTMGAALSVFYGVFDFGEDASLFYLLKQDRLNPNAVTFACACTYGKLGAIAGSLFALAIFLALALVDRIIPKVRP